MPKITDIKQQVKRQDRYSIFVDDKYLFSLSENELMSSGIKIDKEYNKNELEELKKTAVLDKAYMQTINLLSRRPRSEWELRDYLKRKDYNPEFIDITIERLEQRNLVNDLDFAKSWVTNRRLLKSTSKRKLQMELRSKRINDEIIAEVLRSDETDEVEVLKQLIERKKAQTRYQDEIKLTQYLIRQGFNYQDIKQALKSD